MPVACSAKLGGGSPLRPFQQGSQTRPTRTVPPGESPQAFGAKPMPGLSIVSIMQAGNNGALVPCRTIAKSRGSSDRASSFPRRRESRDVAGKKRCWLIALLDSRLRGKDVMVARLLPSTSLLEKTLQSSCGALAGSFNFLGRGLRWGIHPPNPVNWGSPPTIGVNGAALSLPQIYWMGPAGNN